MNTYENIYTNNTRSGIALKGLTERIGSLFTNKGLRMSPRFLRRQTEDFNPAFGAGFINKTECLIRAFVEIGERARASIIIGGLIGHLGDSKVWIFDNWLTKVFRLIGEFQAALVIGDRAEIDRRRYELSELLAAQII